ncbi:MAG: site-2 protease family protein [Candidatus Zambryskibacteria bacterium]|nr:site-2 protease family protein [Candidatus Zambryskibacteria bacterium]
MSIIIFITSLAILILVHEFGHFIVAKKFGIRVDEFGLGFPPRLLSKKWEETIYSLNLIPFGGFVKIFGEDFQTPSENVAAPACAGRPSTLGVTADQTSFQYKPKWIQAFVLVAGVTANIIFAWLLISFLFLKSDGIIAFLEGAKTTLFIAKETIFGLAIFLWNIITFTADFSQISGPVGIASIFGEATMLGLSHIIYLTAVISINLAVINLLPFPALDGGRLLFVGVEAIIRRPISQKIIHYSNVLGFAFLIMLMIMVTGHDILKLL